MMYSRLTAAVALAALCASGVGAAPAAVPAPAATPLKTIKHVYATRLCTGLRRSIAPAIGRVLQNDRTIATSRPLLKDYVKNTSVGSQAAVDMDVMRLETLIDPLVKNTEAIGTLLEDPVFPQQPQSDTDKQLLQLRAHLVQVLAQQKQALDLVSGFVDTQQLAELQAAGHEYDKVINATETASSANASAPNTSPTTAPANILNAGVSTADDPSRKYDPRFTNTGSQVGYNPLNAFDQQMEYYQAQIEQSENLAAKAVFKAVPLCGGHVPAPAAPSPVPVPAAGAPSPAPSGKP